MEFQTFLSELKLTGYLLTALVCLLFLLRKHIWESPLNRVEYMNAIASIRNYLNKIG